MYLIKFTKNNKDYLCHDGKNFITCYADELMISLIEKGVDIICVESIDNLYNLVGGSNYAITDFIGDGSPFFMGVEIVNNSAPLNYYVSVNKQETKESCHEGYNFRKG